MLALFVIALAVGAAFGLGVYVGRRSRRGALAYGRLAGYPSVPSGTGTITFGGAWDDETPRARAARFAKERK